MTFDELLAVVDDTIIDVYYTTPSDYHKTVYEGHDYDFQYEKLQPRYRTALEDAEVFRVWSADDVLCIGVDLYDESLDEEE